MALCICKSSQYMGFTVFYIDQSAMQIGMPWRERKYWRAVDAVLC